jgi:uncharacterized surface protein with fasciclin (FAS1) repeats
MKVAPWSSLFVGSALLLAACMPVQPVADGGAMPMATPMASPTSNAAGAAAPAAAAAMPEMGTIVDIAVGNPDFSTLVEAVTAAGLVDVLADPEAEWTVFAPTNAAFAALPEGVLEMVLADQELLTRILTYHVVEGTVTSDQVSTMMAPTMEMGSVGGDLLGGQLDVQLTDGKVTVNGANVVMADILASNGVIHVIDAVLLPADVAAMVNQ